MSITISVVVLTCDRPESLRACLEALTRQSRVADEIVIVDNGHERPENTDEGLAALLDQAGSSGTPRIVRGAPEKEWATSRNLGVREAKGDWIAFTDDDCVPGENWLEQIERLAAEGHDAVGGMVLPPEGLRYPWWWHPEMSWAVGLSVPEQAMADAAGSVYYPATANWASRREVPLREPFQTLESRSPAGGEEKNLYQAGREDAELWRRLRRKGYRCSFDPRLRVVHHIAPSRLRWFPVLRRARNDGIALQRREARVEFLTPALDALLYLPCGLVFGVWRGPHAVWREAAWRIVWAARQWGQWQQHARSNGPARAGLRFLGLAGKSLFNRLRGYAKALARRVGIAVVRIKRPPRKTPQGAKVTNRRSPLAMERSIVVAAAGYIGDLVLLHAFLTGLRECRPEVAISLITTRNGELLYRHDPSVDHLLVVGDSDSTRRNDDAEIRQLLHRRRVDLILVPYFYRVNPKPLFSRPEARVVTFSEQVGFRRQWWYDRADKRISRAVGEPEGHNLYRLFHEAGFEGRLPESPLALLADEADQVQQWTGENNLHQSAFIVVAPGSGKSEKFWIEERWVAVVRYLVEEYQQKVVLFGAPEEQPLRARIQEAAGPDVVVWPFDDLRLGAGLLSLARLVLGCDSGVKHLAEAMDVATLTLFGPTDERQWGALRRPHEHGVIRGCTWDLTPEERVGLSDDHQMRCIGVDQVRRALDEMLRER